MTLRNIIVKMWNNLQSYEGTGLSASTLKNIALLLNNNRSERDTVDIAQYDLHIDNCDLDMYNNDPFNYIISTKFIHSRWGDDDIYNEEIFLLEYIAATYDGFTIDNITEYVKEIDYSDTYTLIGGTIGMFLNIIKQLNPHINDETKLWLELQ
jgi:hypothetical protein